MLRAEKVNRQFIRKSKGTNVFLALKETDFELENGRFAVVSGRSGSGKSTFLNIMSGLLSPTSGKVFMGDRELYALSDKELSKYRNRMFGLIPQGQSAIYTLSVIENIMLPYTLYGEYEKGKSYAQELLELMDIAHLKNVMPAELSGGEMRRMAIARALVKKPEVVFADEPTGDLDDENTRVVFELFRQIADRGTAVLMVTHENEAAQYADNVYRMKEGILEKVS